MENTLAIFKGTTLACWGEDNMAQKGRVTGPRSHSQAACKSGAKKERLQMVEADSSPSEQDLALGWGLQWAAET